MSAAVTMVLRVVEEVLAPWNPGGSARRSGTQGLCISTLFFLQRRAKSIGPQREVSKVICVVIRRKKKKHFVKFAEIIRKLRWL